MKWGRGGDAWQPPPSAIATCRTRSFPQYKSTRSLLPALPLPARIAHFFLFVHKQLEQLLCLVHSIANRNATLLSFSSSCVSNCSVLDCRWSTASEPSERVLSAPAEESAAAESRPVCGRASSERASLRFEASCCSTQASLSLPLLRFDCSKAECKKSKKHPALYLFFSVSKTEPAQ